VGQALLVFGGDGDMLQQPPPALDDDDEEEEGGGGGGMRPMGAKGQRVKTASRREDLSDFWRLDCDCGGRGGLRWTRLEVDAGVDGPFFTL
jgi:hypothetical protein